MSMPVRNIAYQPETRTTIRATRLPGMNDIQKNARVCAPGGHVWGRAMQRQVGSSNANNVLLRLLCERLCRLLCRLLRRLHVNLHCSRNQHKVSQSAWFVSRPCTQSKYFCCSAVVTGPRPPVPMLRLSNSRIGVTSAAVPVKNASSAL